MTKTLDDQLHSLKLSFLDLMSSEEGRYPSQPSMAMGYVG